MSSMAQFAAGIVNHQDEKTASDWFDALYNASRGAGGADPAADWTAFQTRLDAEATAFGSTVVHYFGEQLAAASATPLADVDALAAEWQSSSATVLDWYRQAHPAAAYAGEPVAEGGADGAAEHYDEELWDSFLKEKAPYWNGAEDKWDEFRTWFLYEAGEQHLTVPANGFIGYVEAHAEGKVTAFGDYEIHIADHDEDEDGYDGVAELYSDFSVEELEQLVSEGALVVNVQE